MQAFFSEQELRRFFADNKIIEDGEETSADGAKDGFYPGDKLIESSDTDTETLSSMQSQTIDSLEK